MAVEIESIINIVDRIIADIESSLNVQTPAVDVAFNKVLAAILAGEFGILQRHALDRQKQCFPQYASDFFLTAWGELTNENQEPASAAILEATATGTNGIIIEAGNLGPRWISQSGILFYNKSQQIIAAGTAILEIEAVTAGIIGNLETGEELTIIAPQAGLDDKITVDSILSAGTEKQSNNDYRSEIVNKVARPPRGGTSADYFFWGTNVPNFIDIYPYAGNLPGKINIYGVVDDQADGIPTSAQLADLKIYIENAARLPLWAEEKLPNGDDRLNVYASVPTQFDIDIVGLEPNTQILRDAITETLTNYFTARRPYIGGLSLEREGEITNNKIISIIDSEIEALSGIGFASVTFALTADPTSFLSAYVLTEGERAKLQNISISGV